MDLMFRDESKHVIKRARKTTTKRQQSTKLAEAATLSPCLTSPPSPARSSISSPSPLVVGQPRPFLEDGSPLSEDVSLFGGPNSVDISGSASNASDVDVDPLRSHSHIPSDSMTIVTRLGPSISSLPTESLHDRGISFFFARYVATDHGCYQNYDFIYDVWKPNKVVGTGADTTDCITASMTAVGLTSLSKLTRCPETMRQARNSYTVALGLANAALSNPVEATKDSTMLAVLILGTYEFVSGRTPQTISAWQHHVNGAATLASMRGGAQFRTKAGARMFIMLCHTVLISCVRSGLPMPQSMVDLRNELWHLTDTRGPVWRVVDTLYNALQVRHDIKSGKIVGVTATVESLCAVEDQFAALVSDMPPSWVYRSAELSRPHPAVLGNSCHIYKGLTQATTWNGIRTMRMLVQETIVETLCGSVEDPTMLPPDQQRQLVKAMKLIQMLGEAFVASVPQHFGIVSGRDIMRSSAGQQTVTPISPAELPQRILSSSLKPKALPSSTATTPSAENASSNRKPTLVDPTQSTGHERGAERFLTLATASHTIIWPLYTVGMSSSSTPEMLAYALDRLEAIYRETGFDQARIVSDTIKEQVHTLMWDQIPTSKLPEVPESVLPIMV